MRRLIPALLPVALLAACATAPLPEPAELPPQPQPLPAPGARPVASLEEIAGTWDIVSFDGHSPPRLDNDGQRHAYVDIGPQGMRFSISCNHSSMAGRIEGGVLHPAAIDHGMTTQMGCGPVAEARENAFFHFFRSRPRVTLLPGGRLLLESPGHELLLERAEVRRLAMGPALPEITGSWRVVGFTQFEGGGYRGWGAMFSPGRVTIANGQLSYSRCPAAAVRFTYTADFTLRRDGGEGGCGGAKPPPTEVEPKLAALLAQSPEAERVNDKRFILRSADYAVLLTSEADYQREFGEWAAEWERNPG